MKTTVEITDSLLQEAKKVAARDRVTLRQLVELGLRRVLSERKQRKKYKLKDCSFKGNGLTPEFEGASWEQIRAAIYEGHGG